MIGRRRHPRRQPPAVHRPTPPPAPETEAEVLHRDPMAPFVAGGQVPTADDLAALVELDEPPPLSKGQIAKLEALTAMWVREVRVGGPMPEDTLLYSAPKPPPPRRRAAEVPYEPEPLPVVDEDAPQEEGVPDDPAGRFAPDPAGSSPRVVRDWVSRHDPRSREFDVRARLRAKVPVQDRVWDIGPVFDQGTTPPLSLRDASGCVGMAVAAAANVLARNYFDPAGRALLNKDEALNLYDRAQDLDHVSGKAYAGTSVLAGMLAGREAGLWGEFLWAFGTRDIAQAVLQVGPVVVGIPWDTRLEEPDAHGIVTPGGAQAGGHALALVGIVTARGGQPGPFFVLQQSRGESEGDRGLIYLHHRHLSALLAGIGEAAIPVPPGWAP
jgi:hypothetical protein